MADGQHCACDKGTDVTTDRLLVQSNGRATSRHTRPFARSGPPVAHPLRRVARCHLRVALIGWRVALFGRRIDISALTRQSQKGGMPCKKPRGPSTSGDTRGWGAEGRLRMGDDPLSGGGDPLSAGRARLIAWCGPLQMRRSRLLLRWRCGGQSGRPCFDAAFPGPNPRRRRATGRSPPAKRS